MLDLIQIELASVRKIAELADDGFLLYLIDMAIQEANQETGASIDKAGTPADKRCNKKKHTNDPDFA